MPAYSCKTLPPEHQADATLSQANPTSGSAYTVLDTTPNCRIIGVTVSVTWTGQPTPLELIITIDGQTLTFSQANPVSATKYYAHLNAGNAPAAQNLRVWDQDSDVNFLLEGRSIKIEAKTTGGATSDLSARVLYAKY